MDKESLLSGGRNLGGAAAAVKGFSWKRDDWAKIVGGVNPPGGWPQKGDPDHYVLSGTDPGNYRFVRNDEAIDLIKDRTFHILKRKDIEYLIGHPVLIRDDGLPILDTLERNLLFSSVHLRSRLKDPSLSPKVRSEIADELRNILTGPMGSRKVVARAKNFIEGNDTEESKRAGYCTNPDDHAALHEIQEWLRLPLVLQRAEASALHKLRDAGVAGEIRIPLARQNVLGMKMGMFDKCQSFVIEHDWAGVMRGATFSGPEDGSSGDVELPFDNCCFEFIITGRRVMAMAANPPEGGDIRLCPVILTKAGWAVVLTYQIDSAWRWGCHLVDGGYDQGKLIPVNDAMRPLVDLLAENIRAICITMEAEITRRDVVRIDAKLNHAREKRGKLPLYDYHVVSLARREAVLPRGEPLDPDRDITRKRLHFVRSHWRTYPTHRTRIKWHLRGDPDLGFVDKNYKL